MCLRVPTCCDIPMYVWFISSCSNYNLMVQTGQYLNIVAQNISECVTVAWHSVFTKPSR